MAAANIIGNMACQLVAKKKMEAHDGTDQNKMRCYGTKINSLSALPTYL